MFMKLTMLSSVVEFLGKNFFYYWVLFCSIFFILVVGFLGVL
jgi:hypothetical protein